jgi:LytS/YehU family sensor histidine kinase
VDAREAERQASRLLLETSRLEASLRQAELDALRQRLHPHFLFNSLQNISVLTEHDPVTSSRMLTKLGDLLRVSLRGDARPETTLESEIALTRTYLAVEEMRFGDRLSTCVDLEPGTERALVPSLLLQPIVENAIRHGLEPAGRAGVIVIRSRIAADTLVLTITDNGAGPPAEGAAAPRFGIGLGATCERLALMYPGRHTFSMRAAAAGGTEVRLTLPLAFEPVAEEAARVRAARADRRR